MASETIGSNHGVMPATSTVDSLCAYCGVGCGMVLHVSAPDGNSLPLVTKTTGRKDHPTNFGRLCTKGSTTSDMLAAPGRMDKASMRTSRDADRESVGIDHAIGFAARRMRDIVDEHGPDSEDQRFECIHGPAPIAA